MRRLLPLCLAAAALATALPAAAQDEAIGKQLFDTHCAVCHGTSARGDGDMSGIMTIPAPDLTLLSRQNDGQFPMLKVVHIIDGRTGVRAHGNPMPLFGDTFGAAEDTTADPYGKVIVSRGKVMSVALYLESLQR